MLGAYEFLQNWHLERYLKDGAKYNGQRIYQIAGGDWRLTNVRTGETLEGFLSP